MKEDDAKVIVVMGSDSDLGVMRKCSEMLDKFEIPYEMTVASAHRSPARVAKLASGARQRGIRVIIAAAGHAAHLAGVVAAHTTVPVIGVPIDSSCLKGLDALLATVQMPPGIPVATMAIGKPGATNAGILAAQIIAVADSDVAVRLDAFKREMEEKVAQRAKRIENTT